MGHKIYVDPYAFLGAAAALLLLPLEWAAAMVISAAFHEFCHYIAIRGCGNTVEKITIGTSGVEMKVADMSRGEELLCAAAGPTGSLSLMLLAQWMPQLAVCGMVHGIFNLIPVFPLDGGRILNCLASDKTCRLVRSGVTIFVLVLAVWVIKYSVIPAFVAAGCMIRFLVRNIPCKEGQLRVQ